MTTQIVCGNPNLILEMQRMVSMIFIVYTPPFHMPSPLIQQISFCFSKDGQSYLLKYIHPHCLPFDCLKVDPKKGNSVTVPFTGTLLFMDLLIFLFFDLTVASKTVAISNLNMVCKAHHKQP